MLPIERDSDPRLVGRDDRACVDDRRGFPAAAVDIGRSLAAAGGLGVGFVRIAGRLVRPDGVQRNLRRIGFVITKGNGPQNKETHRNGVVTAAMNEAWRVTNGTQRIGVVSCYHPSRCVSQCNTDRQTDREL